VHKPISFFEAWALPGVILYSSAFFCTKMAVYCLLLQLPMYLHEVLKYDDGRIANVQTTIDIGGILGSILLGLVSDKMYGKRSPVAFVAVSASMGMMYYLSIIAEQGGIPTGTLFVLMFLIGFFISGLANMIGSACAADLGKQPALKGNHRAVSTVTGIIDGSGSMGTAVGSFASGLLEKRYGWAKGYFLFMAIDISVALIPVVVIAYKEVKEIIMLKKSEKKMGLTSD
jgi:MFS transporter, OPA family, solute carrier family 37 (glycerol-3-phosphate transporter), member 3